LALLANDNIASIFALMMHYKIARISVLTMMDGTTHTYLNVRRSTVCWQQMQDIL